MDSRRGKGERVVVPANAGTYNTGTEPKPPAALIEEQYANAITGKAS